jgi:hypothetical protein
LPGNSRACASESAIVTAASMTVRTCNATYICSSSFLPLGE